MPAMGATNVVKVFTHWPELKHRDKVGLLFMANMAKDADEPPVYWGGWEAIARALGLDLGDREDAKAQANASEQVRRVMASLAKAGVVVSSARARTHVRAEYALALDPRFTFKPTGAGREVSWERINRECNSTEKVGQVPTEKVPLIPPKRCPTSHQKGGNSPTEKVPPRNTEEPLEEYREDIQIGNVVNSPAQAREEAIAEKNLDDDFSQPEESAARLQARADAIKADTPGSIDAERVRQSQALLKMQAEYEQNLAREGIAQ